MKKMSIVTRITLFVLAALFLCSAAIGTLSYLLERNEIIAESAKRALSVAKTVASALDPEQYAHIMASGEMNDYYYEYKAFLDETFDRCGLVYLYVIDKEYDDQTTYFAEGYPAEGRDDEMPFYLGDNEDADVYPQEMFDTLASGLDSVTGEYNLGGFGSMVSGYSPIVSADGRVLGVVGVDLAINEALSSAGRFGLYMIAITATMCTLIAVTIVWFMRKYVGRPIRELIAGARRLAAGDINVSLGALRRGDEIGLLADSFERVVQALSRLMADTNHLVKAATEGRLATRADAAVHEGEYRLIVEGINNTMDAVATPLQAAVGVMREMAEGNLNVSVRGEFKGDLALMQHAINDTVANIKGYVSEITAVLSAMAAGDFTMEITTDYLGDFTSLKESINSIADSMNTLMLGINASAERVAQGTRQVSESAEAASRGASEQASFIGDLSANITRMAEQTQITARNASQTSGQTLDTKRYADEGANLMREMQSAMDEINAASAGITRVINVINDIAFKTNMLALNAAVEATRAGERGEGFAVVAGEVRSLAARSAEAAKETEGLVKAANIKTQAGARLASMTAEALAKIAESADRSAQVVRQIADASGEQAAGIAQVHGGLERISGVVQANSSTALQSAESARVLSGQAEALKQLVARFHLRA